MDLSLIEHHPQRVLEDFRQGEFDQIEIIGEADEKAFFELCFREKILLALAEAMPTARQKVEVPLWCILAANLSLKLHVEMSFLAWERVCQCGGLLSALDPKIAAKHLDPQTKALWIQRAGFNQKNRYARTTPCDQDTLRKALKDVAAERWLTWFNTAVQQVFQRYGFFDPEGIFIGDASYLFVPDNPAYEGSVVLWFDEHNHPVDYDKLSPEERKRAHRERCYKWVSLLHVRRGAHVYAAAAVVSGKAHEAPVLFGLVEQFVQAVGPGVIKLLILDRGFIDGKNLSRCKAQWGIDVLIPLKRKMDLWTDAWALGQREPWQVVPVAVPPPRPAPAHQPEDVRRREQKRQATLAARRAAPDPATVQTQTEYCAISGFTSWSEATVPLNVVLMRDRYADGHADEWALISTRAYSQAQQPQQDYRLRTDIEERHRQLKCFYDLTRFGSREFSAIVAQVVMVLLSYTLRQWQLWKHHQEVLAGRAPDAIHRALNLRKDYVVIYHQRAYAELPLVQFTREVLELEPEARAKALAKIKQLEQSMLHPEPEPWTVNRPRRSLLDSS
jgi:hypothetical protein